MGSSIVYRPKKNGSMRLVMAQRILCFRGKLVGRGTRQYQSRKTSGERRVPPSRRNSTGSTGHDRKRVGMDVVESTFLRQYKPLAYCEKCSCAKGRFIL